MALSPVPSSVCSSTASRPGSPVSLSPSGTDIEPTSIRIPMRRPIESTGWRASSELEGLTAIGVGLAAAAVPVAMASSSKAIRLLAPDMSQMLTTVGATIAGFSHVSALRRMGGDPYGYGQWRAAGAGSAIATPMLGAMLSHSLELDAFDPSLFFGCLVSGALLVSSGMWLQILFDRRPNTREENFRTQSASYAAAGLMAIGIGWQATTLSIDAFQRIQEGGGVLPDGIDGRAAGTVAVSLGALMTLAGFAVALHARQHGRETQRVAALMVGVSGIAAAMVGAAFFASASLALISVDSVGATSLRQNMFCSKAIRQPQGRSPSLTNN